MIRYYFRQALIMMRQNGLFSAIYIVGTGLSIAFAMTLFIIFYIKLGPVYPEYKRDRVIYLKNINHIIQSRSSYSITNSQASSNLIEKFSKIKGCEAVSVYAGKYGYQFTVNDIEQCKGLFVNNNYWNLFEYKFIAGRPFVPSDKNASTVIVSDKFAESLFATTDVIGKEINVNNTRNRIVGVVKAAGGATPESYAQFWMPIEHSLFKEGEPHPIVGGYFIQILCGSAADKPSVMAEMEAIVARLAQEFPEGESFKPVINEHWAQALDVRRDVDFETQAVDEVDFYDVVSKYLYVLLALIFIPVLNLSGMIASRMSGRMDEVGVRKAFGATNGTILLQVLCENLLLTALGALLGVLLSYLLTYTASDWILSILAGRRDLSAPESVITPEMLFNPAIIAATILLTLLLNTLAAIIPTLSALRKSITYSLYNKR